MGEIFYVSSTKARALSKRWSPRGLREARGALTRVVLHASIAAEHRRRRSIEIDRDRGGAAALVHARGVDAGERVDHRRRLFVALVDRREGGERLVFLALRKEELGVAVL